MDENIRMPHIPIASTSAGTILIGTTLERIRSALEQYLWAERTGMWEAIEMNTIQEFAAAFYVANPAYLVESVEKTLEAIEKALRAAQKEVKAAQAAKEKIREHGASILHAIFDEYGQTDLQSSQVFLEYHYRAAIAEAKGKPALPTKEAKAAAEAELRSVVIDGETFALSPGKGARAETIIRRVDTNGKATGAELPTATGGGTADTSALVTALKSMSATKMGSAVGGAEIQKALGIDQSAWTKLKTAALASGAIKQAGERRGAKYYLP